VKIQWAKSKATHFHPLNKGLKPIEALWKNGFFVSIPLDGCRNTSLDRKGPGPLASGDKEMIEHKNNPRGEGQ
jgi:hypothetical protein